MNKLCENCPYNVPYFSIINPCENCQNNDFTINNTVTTTTTTDMQTLQITYGKNTGDVCVSRLNTGLPTADEYRKFIEDSMCYPQEWSEPKYICPKCGGGMCRNEMVVLTSYPVQYKYKCDKCGYVEYQFG